MERPESESCSYSFYHNETMRSKRETNKTYLILELSKQDLNRSGLGWRIIEMLGGIRAAVENGYKPVIDWQSYPIPDYDGAGDVNIWELFFEQPCGCGLKEAYESKDYCMLDSICDLKRYRTIKHTDLLEYDNPEGQIWRYYFHKYIRLKAELESHFSKQYGKLGLTGNTLGVLCRGTDYTYLKPPRHGIIPALEEMILIAQKNMRMFCADFLFLATEDEDVLEQFTLAFGKQIKMVESVRYRLTEREILGAKMSGQSGYDRDSRYLLSLYLISRLEGRVYSACSGSMVSALMGTRPQHYSYVYPGQYSHLGIVVCSELEEEENALLYVYDKPMLYYTLNQMVLMGVRKIALIAAPHLIPFYKNLLEGENLKGIELFYWEKNGDITDILRHKIQFIKNNRICIWFEEELFFGGNSGAVLSQAAQEFDGAYIFACTTCAPGVYGYAKINGTTDMPRHIYVQDKASAGPDKVLAGVYIFDLDFSEVLERVYNCNSTVTLENILNEYIKRKKLILHEFNRGAIWIRLNTLAKCQDASQIIRIVQSQQGKLVGAVDQTLKMMR